MKFVKYKNLSLESSVPLTTLTCNYINWVCGMLLTKQESLDARENVPTFQESGMRHNRFYFYGTNQESYECPHIITGTLAVQGRDSNSHYNWSLLLRPLNSSWLRYRASEVSLTFIDT